MYRSMLFVPGDSEKITKSEQVRPDAVILDLEDAVAPANRPTARQIVRSYLEQTCGRRQSALFVRINPLGTPEALEDLAAIMVGAPDGIIQPKAESPLEVQRLAYYLDAFEAQTGISQGSTRIVPVSTEVPEALFALGNYAQVGQRLAGLTGRRRPRRCHRRDQQQGQQRCMEPALCARPLAMPIRRLCRQSSGNRYAVRRFPRRSWLGRRIASGSPRWLQREDCHPPRSGGGH